MSTGGVYVQFSEIIGFPPVQPDGEDEVTVSVRIPDAEQADQPEYVNEVQVGV